MTVLRTADFRGKAAAQGAEVIGGTPEEFAALMRSDLKKWAKVTSTLKLQTE